MTEYRLPADYRSPDERQLWELRPKESVGPLRFGAAVEEAIDVLGATNLISHGVDEASFEGGVYIKFDRDGLSSVTLAGKDGPRLVLEGFNLTGRKPSEIEQWLDDRNEASGGKPDPFVMDIRGDFCSSHFGLRVHASPCGDVLVTTPTAGSASWTAEHLEDDY